MTAAEVRAAHEEILAARGYPAAVERELRDAMTRFLATWGKR